MALQVSRPLCSLARRSYQHLASAVCLFSDPTASTRPRAYEGRKATRPRGRLHGWPYCTDAHIAQEAERQRTEELQGRGRNKATSGEANGPRAPVPWVAVRDSGRTDLEQLLGCIQLPRRVRPLEAPKRLGEPAVEHLRLDAPVCARSSAHAHASMHSDIPELGYVCIGK